MFLIVLKSAWAVASLLASVLGVALTIDAYLDYDKAKKAADTNGKLFITKENLRRNVFRVLGFIILFIVSLIILFTPGLFLSTPLNQVVVLLAITIFFSLDALFDFFSRKYLIKNYVLPELKNDK